MDIWQQKYHPNLVLEVLYLSIHPPLHFRYSIFKRRDKLYYFFSRHRKKRPDTPSSICLMLISIHF